MESRKIYDIIPPQFKSSKEVNILKPEPAAPFEPQKTGGFKDLKFTSINWLVIVSVIFLLILLLIGIVQAIFLKATITIWPSQEKWEFKKNVIVTPAVNSIDFASLTLPGRLIKIEQEFSSQFQATGELKKEGKAKGVIRVYNNYHLPQVLVATTRFLSSEGKLFRSTHRVEIPPGGEQDVEVIAAEPGEEYNIEPTTFSIPGLAGTSRYTQVYGKSFSKMEGGGAETVPQVTAEDIQKAKDTLITKASQKGKEKILSEINKDEDLIFFEDSFSEEVGEPEILAKEGDEVSSFQGKVKVTVQAILLSKKTLNDFVDQMMKKDKGEDKLINEKTLNVKSNLVLADWPSQKLNISISGSANIYTNLDLRGLKNQLAGKSVGEVKNILASQDNIIDHFQIKLVPILKLVPTPWISIPSDLDRVTVELRL